jgi:hypothetical protein
MDSNQVNDLLNAFTSYTSYYGADTELQAEVKKYLLQQLKSLNGDKK